MKAIITCIFLLFVSCTQEPITGIVSDKQSNSTLKDVSVKADNKLVLTDENGYDVAVIHKLEHRTNDK